MLKKIGIALVTFAMLAGNPLSAFAERQEKPLWEIIADSFKDFKIREQDKLRGGKKVDSFQNVADHINKGSDAAKNKSLRGSK